ncbi:MAG: ArsR/SmtB family transcription factor [Nocardioidaceae bacterium]
MSSEVASLRAVAHPVRLRILSLLTGTELSAAEIARELGITHANASYHLRRLADAGVVVEAGRERIRGGVAKRYRHPWDTAPAPAARSEAERSMYVQALAHELVRRAAQRRPETRGHFTDAEMWVDPAVWEQAREHVNAASELVHAAAQPPRTSGAIRINMTAALFEMTQST